MQFEFTGMLMSANKVVMKTMHELRRIDEGELACLHRSRGSPADES